MSPNPLSKLKVVLPMTGITSPQNIVIISNTMYSLLESFSRSLLIKGAKSTKIIQAVANQ